MIFAVKTLNQAVWLTHFSTTKLSQEAHYMVFIAYLSIKITSRDLPLSYYALKQSINFLVDRWDRRFSTWICRLRIRWWRSAEDTWGPLRLPLQKVSWRRSSNLKVSIFHSESFLIALSTCCLVFSSQFFGTGSLLNEKMSYHNRHWKVATIVLRIENLYILY